MASRVAGMRLTAIVCVLLVPILLLSHLTLNNLRHEIANRERESAGVLLASIIMPVAIGLAEGSMTGSQGLAELAKGDALAAELGMTTAYDEVKAKAGSSALTTGEKLFHLVRSINMIGTQSSLLLDSDPETTFLAQTNVQNLPELLLSFHGLYSMLQDSIASKGIDSAEMRDFLFKLGGLDRAIERTRSSVVRAQASSGNVGVYDSSLELVDDISNDIDVTLDVLSTAPQGGEWLALTMLAQQTLNAGRKYQLERAMWNQTMRRLSSLLDERREVLRRQLIWTMGVAALCVLLGAGAAIGMFRSTLRRLDHVALAKEQADAARLEAEAMADCVHKVNEEVTALNRDLADKMLRLKEAQDELVKRGRMEQLGQLTATVAHEIRNPLGAVRTSAFLLERKIRGKGLGVEAQIERINKGVTRCDDIITQLLDYSRTKQLSCRPENLDNWLAGAVEEEAQRLPAVVEITCTLGLGELDVPFDPSRLRRAVVNLMNNACEAMVGTGEDASRFATAQPRLALSTYREGNDVVIRVSDNGPGISAENLARIREPLFTTKSFGTGLGLPAVEKILEQHGGRLVISSVAGKGSQFDIHIPVEGNGQNLTEAA
ncbi:MAG: HAMP domain-containing histidine kinase [Rhizobiales bacterium]|nr:HAMP domain-containing histidine kinase [Hyphomicrobiales bacterium]